MVNSHNDEGSFVSKCKKMVLSLVDEGRHTQGSSQGEIDFIKIH